MTWSDPIVEEVRRARDAYAARFNYDLRAIFRDLKEQEQRGGRKLVSYARDVLEELPGKMQQPTEPSIPASESSVITQAGPVVEH